MDAAQHMDAAARTASLADHLRQLRADNPAMGVKNVCAEIKRNPAFAAVGAKQVRKALALLESSATTPSSAMEPAPAPRSAPAPRKAKGAKKTKPGALREFARAGNNTKLGRLLDGGCDVNELSLIRFMSLTACTSSRPCSSARFSTARPRRCSFCSITGPT